jgi:pyruvate/2-oxoglutarate dehydrogenase complex dihydrolipoamide dehydrogenase (E3) component
MSASNEYHAIVIGSGQGGNPLCMAFADAGLRTALIEGKHVGGTCVNEGCTPTKTMVASARVAYLMRRGVGYGVHTGNIHIDMERFRQRKHDIVNSFRNGVFRPPKEGGGWVSRCSEPASGSSLKGPCRKSTRK